MRVIAGNFKGRTLRTIAGLDVRPTSDRLRETLFNILNPYIKGINFLDICSGSGAVAIEALSRGANRATLIDSSKQSVKMIYQNLEHCQIPKTQVKVFSIDAKAALKQLSKDSETFDIVYFDPPYNSNIYIPVLEFLGENTILSNDAKIVVEHHSKSPLPEAIGSLACYRVLKQGDTQLDFYQVKGLS